MAASPLPPPSSGLFLEVSFRRLLRACEAVVADDGASGGGDSNGADTAGPMHPLALRSDLRGGAWRTSPVFHHYVETLQDQLADLEAAAGPERLPADLVAAYRARADAVVASLGAQSPPPLVVPRPADAAAVAAAAAASASAGPPPLSTDAGAPADAAGQAARSALLGGVARGAGPGFASATTRPDQAIRARSSAAPASTAGLGKAAASTIATQRGLQEALTDDLVGLAAGLRANAEAARDALRSRGRLVDGAEVALDSTLASARTAAAGATAALRRSRRGCWSTCVVFLSVAGVFTATFLYIRATSLLGYSARRAAAGAAKRAAKVEAAARAREEARTEL